MKESCRTSGSHSLQISSRSNSGSYEEPPPPGASCPGPLSVQRVGKTVGGVRITGGMLNGSKAQPRDGGGPGCVTCVVVPTVYVTVPS